MAFKIFLSPPHMCGKEREHVREAFDTNWIAPYGPQIGEFEKEMAACTGVESALALSSGTAAIHLALRWFGVCPGDYVFCSDFTFIGSCDAILYERAVPVFIDSEPESWNMSPEALERAFQWAREQGKMPRAVIIVDLYGESADWDRLLPICLRYGVPVIEDAAEAVGTKYMGRSCGSFGSIGVFSFNGNKLITTSGGGMAVSNNALAIQKMQFWSTQAREFTLWYEHREYGYNYRMSNVCAAIGRGQLEFLESKLNLRRRIYDAYGHGLKGIPARLKQSGVKCRPNHWLNLLYLETERVLPTDIVIWLQNAEIEARPAWKPMHMQPLFQGAKFFSHYEDNRPSVGSEVFAHAVCLPSGDGMSMNEQQTVIDELQKCFRTLEQKGLRERA